MGFLLHRGILGSRTGCSTRYRLALKRRPKLGASPRRRGPSPLQSKVWLSRLLLTTLRLARYRSWYQLFSLLPLTVAMSASRALHATSPRAAQTTRLRGCPQHLILWRDLSLLIRAPRLRRPDTMVLAGVAGLYSKYLSDFFETQTNASICLHFLPYSAAQSELAGITSAIWGCIYPALRVFHRLFFYRDFATLCAVAFHQKNATLLATWLARFMERIDARMHRKFLRFLSVFLRRVHESKSPSLTHTGVKLTLKGKISVSGSAKKRTQHIAYGVRSLSRKSHRISFAQAVVRTRTGVMGLKCFIFY